MKKIHLILFVLVGLIAIISCEKDETKIVFDLGNTTAPALTSPTGGTSFVLSEENDTVTMATFTWNEADFGYDAAILYLVQFDFAGNDFASAVTLGNTANLEYSITVGEMNQKMLLADGVFGIVNSIETRIAAVIQAIDKSGIDTLYSSTLALDITPYEVILVYPRLFVPGEHNGWDAADSTSSIYSVKSNDKYEGYIYTTVNPSGFKLLYVPAWEEDNTIGDPDAAGTSGTLQIGSWGGNNIMITTDPGYYQIKADLNALTYSHLRTEWGLIGDATPGGWDNDTDMTYNVGEEVWEVTLDLTGGGKIKFRANDDWGLNYGSNNANGICDEGGSDIPIDMTGNYTVTLDLRGPLYRYTIVKN
jgi:hypothetical protein